MATVRGSKGAGRNSSRPRSPRHAPEAARAIIVEAALTFLAKRPFRELNVGLLMAATPLSRPAFYRYFTDVEDLIEQLLAEFERGMQEQAMSWFTSEVATAAESMKQFRDSMAGLIRIVARSGPLYRAISEAAPLHPGLERVWRRFMGEWDSAVARRIRLEQGAGLIDPTLEADRIAHALNLMDATLMIHAFGKGRVRPAEIEAVIETICEVWFRVLWGRSPAKRAANPSGSRRSRQ